MKIRVNALIGENMSTGESIPIPIIGGGASAEIIINEKGTATAQAMTPTVVRTFNLTKGTYLVYYRQLGVINANVGISLKQNDVEHTAVNSLTDSNYSAQPNLCVPVIVNTDSVFTISLNSTVKFTDRAYTFTVLRFVDGGSGGGSNVTIEDNPDGGVDLTVDDQTRTLATEGEVSDVKADLKELDNIVFTKTKNLYDGTVLHGVRTVSSGSKLQQYPVGGLGAGYYTARVKIEPNTTYSIIKEHTNYFVASTSSNLISIEDFSTTNPISFVNFHSITTDSSLSNITFTSSSTDEYLYICYTLTNEPCRIAVYEGVYIDFQPEIATNIYTKAEINSIVRDLYAKYDAIPEELTVFLPCSNGDYLGVIFVHNTANFNNCDCWRLDAMFLYDSSFHKKLEEPFIASYNEWECAIKELGASDFIGGRAHGDEKYTNINVLFDGEYIDIENSLSFERHFNKLEIFENSLLNRVDSPSDIVAKHQKLYTFDKNGITIEQKIEFLQNMTMTTSFLCMCAVRRRLGETSSDTYSQDLPYVSDSGYRDTDFEVLDLHINHNNFVYSNGVKKATLFNKGNGYKLETVVTISNDSNLPNNAMAFSNSPQYNKLYFDFCGDNYTVNAGDVWKNKSNYQFDYHGFTE